MLTYPVRNAACRCDTAAQQDVYRDSGRFEAEAGNGGNRWLCGGEFGPCPLWEAAATVLAAPVSPSLFTPCSYRHRA